MIKKPIMVCELGKEHNGDIEKAKQMLREAKKCGFDIAKLQAYSLDDLNDKHSNNRRYRQCWFNLEQLGDLAKYAYDIEMPLFCSVFSKSMIKPLSVIFREIKIPSTYLTNEVFVRECINSFNTVHISTGMHTLEEITACYRAYTNYNKALTSPRTLIFYHCVSEYPTMFVDSKLSRLKLIEPNLNGFSDHSIGNRQMLVAALLGASIIEKHFSLSPSAASWCISPDEMIEFNSLVTMMIEGISDKEMTETERKNYDFYKTEFESLNTNRK